MVSLVFKIKDLKMKNEFLEELGHQPIVNTFKLAYKMLLSNKILFAVMTSIFIFLSILPSLVPFIIRGVTGQISILIIGLISAIFSVILEVFTQSNYFYMCKMLLDSHNEEEFVEKMATTKVSVLFTNYLVRALGSSLAIILIVMPFILIREELAMGKYWDMFLILLLLLFLYVYSIVAYKIALSKNFKEAFMATFSLFSPSVWQQSLNLYYAKFVIFLGFILLGMDYVLTLINERIALMEYYIVSLIIMTISTLFVTLYVLPFAMMIAEYISTKK
jgi:hypothetical protein